MNNLVNQLTGTNHMTDVLMMAWADKHPILFTLIQITPPYIYVAATIVGVSLVNKLIRGRNHG